jgi:hypothetical protein
MKDLKSFQKDIEILEKCDTFNLSKPEEEHMEN